MRQAITVGSVEKLSGRDAQLQDRLQEIMREELRWIPDTEVADRLVVNSKIQLKELQRSCTEGGEDADVLVAFAGLSLNAIARTVWRTNRTCGPQFINDWLTSAQDDIVRFSGEHPEDRETFMSTVTRFTDFSEGLRLQSWLLGIAAPSGDYTPKEFAAGVATGNIYIERALLLLPLIQAE